MTTITMKEVAAFLLGEAPLDGAWFGDTRPSEHGQFWWRKHLRAALSAPATAPDELERLKTESEERLQNCAALVAEKEQLRKDAERYQWLKSAKGLTLESERGAPWTMENGSTFSPSHRLCAGGTQFAPHETLDDAIDAAMKGTP